MGADEAHGEATDRLPSALSNPPALCDVSPNCRWRQLPRVVLGLRHVVERALGFVAQYFADELDQPYPRPFWSESISVELMAALEVYTMSSPEPDNSLSCCCGSCVGLVDC